MTTHPGPTFPGACWQIDPQGPMVPRGYPAWVLNNNNFSTLILIHIATYSNFIILWEWFHMLFLTYLSPIICVIFTIIELSQRELYNFQLIFTINFSKLYTCWFEDCFWLVYFLACLKLANRINWNWWFG